MCQPYIESATAFSDEAVRVVVILSWILNIMCREKLVDVILFHSYQVSRMLRGSHAILPYQSATHGSTTFLLLPRNH